MSLFVWSIGWNAGEQQSSLCHHEISKRIYLCFSIHKKIMKICLIDENIWSFTDCSHCSTVLFALQYTSVYIQNYKWLKTIKIILIKKFNKVLNKGREILYCDWQNQRVLMFVNFQLLTPFSTSDQNLW